MKKAELFIKIKTELIKFINTKLTILNYYVKSVVTYFPQNEKKIITEGEDFYFNKQDKRIVHYQNHKLNHLLHQVESNKLLELEKLDPINARVRSFGLVGLSVGVLYSHLLHKISRLLQPSYRFTAGLDYGLKIILWHVY